ncbi:hypothetical protein ACFSDD_23205 [Salipiger marinus]|nr:hypothetical protein [Salipiger manganoxidans]MEB3419239.1 hypothetical protein [Salipiger manganoxidans]
MLDAEQIEAFRTAFPETEQHPDPTERSGAPAAAGGTKAADPTAQDRAR